MLTTKIFLAVVGVAYIVLAAWCAIRPDQTSSSVGFELNSGAGQSEFPVVYGGLELALGLAFLLLLVREEYLPFALLLCLIFHVCLVVFRTISFAMFAGIPSTTYILAGVEWVILFGADWRFFLSGQAVNTKPPTSSLQPSPKGTNPQGTSK